ncbi:MAG: hypothetical protein DRO88_04885 [Promethearchaeia archaeon]|nr:MAG: hypothetical protein DRO88_04885 [Candidatus Lokiarchaeia archaeon]
METKHEVELSNGVKICAEADKLDKCYQEFIDAYIKPYYKESNDWNKTLKRSIKEIERLSNILQLSRKKVIQGLLESLENRLHTDIADLNGVDKIEILFESIDDYVETIQKLVQEESNPEEIRLNVSELVENLNLFEIAELLIHFAKKSA